MEKASTTLLAVAMAAAICVWDNEATPDDLVVSPAVRRTGRGHSRPIRLVATNAAKSRGPSITESISSGIKGGWKKVTRALTPKDLTSKANDPTSVFSDARPSPELYVAMARLHEQTGRTAEAEIQYRKALKEDRDNLKAMLGYAHLLDRVGRTAEAVEFYEKAIRAHPREAAPLNDLGLCHARRGKLDDAISALERAVRLQPKRALYRNNLATMLVDDGQLDAAFTHFKAVHGEATAHYNLGYLLQKKGDRPAAAARFAAALRTNPSFKEARSWLQRLQEPAERPVAPSMAAPSMAAPSMATQSLSDDQPRSRNALRPPAPRMQRPNSIHAGRPTVQPARDGSISQPPLRFQPGEPGSPKLRKLPPLPKLRPSHESPSDIPTGAFEKPPVASRPTTPIPPVPDSTLVVPRTANDRGPNERGQSPVSWGNAPDPRNDDAKIRKYSVGPALSLPSSIIRQSSDGPPVPRIQPLPPVAPMPGPAR